MQNKNDPKGVKKEVVEAFAKTIIKFAPPDVLYEVLYGVLNDALKEICEGLA